MLVKPTTHDDYLVREKLKFGEVLDLTGGLGFKGCKLYLAEELWYYCAHCSGLECKIADSKHFGF